MKGRGEDCRLRRRTHSRGMRAEYVELILLEQSLGNTEGMNRPFSDRVGDAAEKTGGTVLFDIRVDDDPRFSRMAAIGFRADGTVIIMMDKNGQLTSAPARGNDDHHIAELTAWCSLPMAQQVSVSYSNAAVILLAELRGSGRLERST